jgi:hypothetical protein
MAFLLCVGIAAAIVACVFGAVYVEGWGYDHIPWLRKFMDAEASLHVPQPRDPADDDLPKSYTDQIPGWDQRP